MSEPTVRADAVDVEQIMRQIRARISEKRGADYTETELRQLASVKLEKFMDPQGLRSDLIEQFRKGQGAPGTETAAAEAAPAGPPPSLYRRVRRFVGSTLRLLSNPYRILALDNRMQMLEIRLQERDSLYYDLMHNLTLEVTRLGIEVHNITMRVESLASRLDFDERRSRSLESVVQYRPQAPSRPQHASPAPAATESIASPDGRPPRPAGVPAAPSEGGEPGGGERRRRRRRRRRRPGQTLAENTTRPQDAAGGQAPGDRNSGASDSGNGFADDRADDDAGDDDGPDATEP